MRRSICIAAGVVVMSTLSLSVVAARAEESEDDAGDAGDSAAEQEQENALRQSLAFEGGYPETVTVGSSSAGSNDMLYAALNAPNGIFWSDDFGDTWHGPTGDADFGTISDVRASDTPGTVFMIGGIGFYRSQDNGATWEEVVEIPNVAQFFAVGDEGLVVVPTRDGSVYVSGDDGDTFNEVEADATHVAVTANNTVLVLVRGSGEESTLYTLADGELTATSATGEWRYMGAHPTDPDFWVLSGSDSVVYTANGSAGPFTEMTLPEGVTNALEPIIRPSSRIYVGSEYTEDNGATWGHGELRNWAAFDDVNGYVYTQTMRGVGRGESEEGPFTNVVTGMTGVTVNDMALDASKEVAWLAAQGGFAKSENFASSIAAGNEPTWEFPILPNENISSGSTVWVDPDNPDVVIAAGVSRVYRSEDGGETWSDTDIDGGEDRPTYADVVEFVGDTSTVYISYYSTESGSDHNSVTGGVLMSTDGGETWSDTGMPAAPAGPMVVNADGQLLVGVGVEQNDDVTNRGVYLYDGSEWTHLSDDADHPTYGALVTGMTFDPETNTVYAVSSGADTEGELYKSNDDGEWAEWSVVGGDSIPSDFWGQAVAVNSNNTDQVFASTARPSGTGEVYSCSVSNDECVVYYTGLKDETFNTMVFDGLVTGSNAGMFAYQSKATLQLTKQAKQRRIVARLTDGATGDSMNGRSIRLMRKVKKSGSFKVFQKKKMKKGKAVFVIGKKGGTFRAQWRPRKQDSGLYTASTSNTVQLQAK